MMTNGTVNLVLLLGVVCGCTSPRDGFEPPDAAAAGAAGGGAGAIDASTGGTGGPAIIDGRAASGDVSPPAGEPDGAPSPGEPDGAPSPAEPDARASCPTPVSRLPAARKVVTTQFDTCALLADGTVRCWGREMVAMGAHVPTVVPGLVGVNDIAAGAGHVCAVVGGGTVRCWGRNDSGQLGDGTITQAEVRTMPVTVTGVDRVAALAGGGGHTCAVITDGSVRCWGANTFGQLGDGTMTPSPVPVTATAASVAVAVAAGDGHTCVVLRDGSVVCWGTQALMPAVGITQATQLAASKANTCVVASGGFVWCWTGSPILVPELSDVVWVATGGPSSCAVGKDGAVRCWGTNSSGQLGDGTTNDAPKPVNVVGLVGATAVATGQGGHTCALTSGGAVRCWGANDDGQLGDCSTRRSLTPVAVTGW
jgi:alpha-tubulin suppressor-like RCC1 family protein